MSTNVLKTGLVVLAFVAWCPSVYAEPYEQDCSSDPIEWVTNAPDENYWRSSQEDYHLERINENGNFAYAEMDYGFNQPFTLEFDIYINSMDYAAEATLGLWDTQDDI